MSTQIQDFDKRLKLIWIREHYQELEVTSNEEYLLELFEKEIEQREERKTNLLLTQAMLPKVNGKCFDWKDIALTVGLSSEDLLSGVFMN